jgi:drug/metabolite transporter (DMT)-like permease
VATALAFLAAACLGAAVVTSKFGLRVLDARSGAAISIPSSTAALLLVSPFFWDSSAFTLRAALVFAVVGFFYPAVVTLLRFHSTDRLGAATTSTVLACTTPLFAVAAAAVWLEEVVPRRAILATCGVVGGIALISLRSAGARIAWRPWWLIFPLAAAIVSGGAQAGVKSGLLLWPSPFAAALIGYLISSFTVLAFDCVRKANRAVRPVGAVLWFGCTGALNGIGVLSLFWALSSAPVSRVAPIVAAYPLVTLFLGAAVLKDEAVNVRIIAGALLTVMSIGYLGSA